MYERVKASNRLKLHLRQCQHFHWQTLTAEQIMAKNQKINLLVQQKKISGFARSFQECENKKSKRREVQLDIPISPVN